MTTICQLGPSIVSPVLSLNRFWRDEIIARMQADTERRQSVAVEAAS
jgi:NADH:ubiquinone oxidoreductase subunit F (NADH-binding)